MFYVDSNMNIDVPKPLFKDKLKKKKKKTLGVFPKHNKRFHFAKYKTL
jgi:hypothetical protein